MPKYLVEGPFDVNDLQEKLNERVAEGWYVGHMFSYSNDDPRILVVFFRLEMADADEFVRFKDVDPPAVA